MTGHWPVPFQSGIDFCARLGNVQCVAEQLVLVADDEGANDIFDRIVVQWDALAVKEADQAWPLPLQVMLGFP